MELEEFIKHNKGIFKQINGGEEALNYLEELKDLREKYKNVSEAFMKVNNSIFDTKMDLNKVKQELNKVKQELQIYKKAYETVCNSLSDKTSCNWGYDDACKFCQEEGPEYKKTTSCVDNIKNFYLQKAKNNIYDS